MHQIRYILIFLIAACILFKAVPSATIAGDSKDALEALLAAQGEPPSRELEFYFRHMGVLQSVRKRVINCREHAELLKDLAICSLTEIHASNISKSVFSSTPKVNVSEDIHYISAVNADPESYELCMAISVEIIAMASKSNVQAIEWAELFCKVKALEIHHAMERELLQALKQKATRG